MARRPIKEAQDAATARLVAQHYTVWLDMVDEELAKRGWSQEVVETRKWTRNGVSSPSE